MLTAAVAAAVLSLVAPLASVFAGIADVPVPAVLTHPLQPQELVQLLALPPTDIGAAMKEDALHDKTSDWAPRYATPNMVKVTPSTGGTWERLDDLNSVWRLRVNSPGALSLNFGFTDYQMPEGGRLFVYSADLRMTIRPFTAADNESHGQLWTPPVVGEDAIIEVVIPNHARKQLRLTLGQVNSGYREFAIPRELRKGDEGGIASGSCNIDVNCPEGAAWQDQINAVGVISFSSSIGSAFCTGYMVNNTSQDRKPYFMSARHCMDENDNMASLVVFWNYQNSTCRPIGSAASGAPGDGPTNMFQTGAFFRASFAASDFTLVELDENPNPAWGVTFAGWDRSDNLAAGSPPVTGVGIHHPSTDEKRISYFGGPGATHPSHGSSWGCSAFPGPGDSTHIKVYWTPGLGVTEPGSSGSPIFDSNKRIIGQLHGGLSACGATGESLSDCYGRIWRSWTGGGSSATRLSDWLDPTNTGALTVDTIGRGLTLSPSGAVTHVGIVGGPFAPASTDYAFSNTSGSSADYTVSIVAGGAAPITLNGGAGPVSGSLANGNTANFTVAVNAAAASSLAAGIYSTSVLFQDTTNDLSYTQTHTIEVGQIGYTTTPANALVSGGPLGGPFSATQVYLLTSTRPTPVTVVVTPSQPWISVNGLTGAQNIVLGGNGATSNVVIGFSAAANGLANGIYNGTVTFNAQSGGAGSNTIRNVTLDVGRYTYAATGLPLSIADNSTVTSTINVTDSYCIGDVDLPIDITHTYIGDLIVQITSPSGTIVRLHNRSGGSTDNLVTTYDDDGGGSPPSGPGTLSMFDGENVNGMWTLTVSDNAGSDVGTLNAWSLKIASAGSACPTRVVVHNVPLDANPGWNGTGSWAFGVPAGLEGDPTSGFSGANVLGYNLSGEYGNNMGVESLTSTAFNMVGKTGAQLKFKRWLGIESSTYDHATVQVSSNGTSWTTIWAHAGATLNETSWSTQSFDISGVADNAPTLYLRWTMGTTDGSITYQGWNIDDIQILAFQPVCEGDINGSQTVDVSDLLTVITNWGPCANCPPTHCPADIAPAPNGDCSINVGDLLMVITNWGGCP